jgi:hypothetical protein
MVSRVNGVVCVVAADTNIHVTREKNKKSEVADEYLLNMRLELGLTS